MAVFDLISIALKTAKRNAPEILTALGVSGLVTTSYLAAKASFQAADSQYETIYVGEDPGVRQKVFDRAKLTWKLYIPAGLSGFATVACIVGSGRASGRRTAAAVAAYSFTERAFTEYKAKAVEALGEGKEQKLRDDIAQDRITRTYDESKELVIVGGGDVLCREDYTGRYFRSDIETLRKAANDINHRVLSDISECANLNEFYDLVGLPPTQKSDLLGWNYEKNLELRFSGGLTPKGEPCLSFEYNYVKPL